MALLTPPPNLRPSKPRITLPAGAIDAHLHMFGPVDKYPFAPDANYLSADATAEMYFRIQDELGLSRAVLVSGGAYGQTYGHLVDMLRAYPDRLRGVVRLPAEVSWDELVELNRSGVRAARFFGPGRVAGMRAELLEMVKAIGWHIQMYLDPDTLLEMEERLLGLNQVVVLDHFAHNSAAGGLDSPNNQALLRMLETGRVWVKLSAPMRVSNLAHPYRDLTPIAQALVRHAPERLVWGTDWPHTLMWDQPMADDGELVDLLEEWVGDATTLRDILVRNPERLYDFPSAA